MKIFETPIMNISMFEEESVATTSSVNTVDETNAALSEALGGVEITEANTVTFTF